MLRVSETLLCCIHIICLLNGLNKADREFQFLSELEPRIIGGTPISITTAPWQVSVRIKVYELIHFGAGHICGGSVLTYRVIISAAHCIVNNNVEFLTFRTAEEFTMVMGSEYLYQKTQDTLQYNVLQLVYNANFNVTTMVDDVALFLIDRVIPSGWPTVSPIKMNDAAKPSGINCLVTGWGKTANGYVASILMGAYVPIVSNSMCSTNYGNNISDSMLCAGYMQTGHVDACQGDSGGPLVCDKLLTGIVSWGNGCAEVGYPGVYTNVSYIIKWIEWANSTFDYDYFVNVEYDYLDGSAAYKHASILLPLVGFQWIWSHL